MIDEYQVPAYLLTELPEIAIEFKNIFPSTSIAKAIQCLSNYTKRVLLQQDLKTVKKCFAVANNIYVNGTIIVKNAVETVYVYFLSKLLSQFRTEEKKQLQALMPLYLYSIYNQQALSQ